MRLGIYLRNMGSESTPETMRACAVAADQSGLDDLWVVDHIAIPPDESEGSDGRYLDPLATLAWLAGFTTRITLGVGVLVLPYRPALATAKWIATIQELSAGRLVLGAGVGWMAAEFRATGVDRARRGAITDETLAVIHACFANDEVEINDQRFLFRPRPARPPIIIGGAPEYAFDRIVRHGDGWMPGRLNDEALATGCEELRARMADAGRPCPQIINLTALPDDDAQAQDRIHALAELGVTGVAHMARYSGADAFKATVDRFSRITVRPGAE